MDFNQLIEQYNSIGIMGLLGALQICPHHCGKNLPFEEMAGKVLIQFHPEDARPPVSWEQFMEAIENYEGGTTGEGIFPVEFTEAILFEKSMWMLSTARFTGFSEILNNQIESIFIIKNKLPKNYVKLVRDACGLLLFMSHSALKAAGHEPSNAEKAGSVPLALPALIEAIKDTDAIYFSKTSLQAYCQRHQYDYSVIREFIAEPGSPALQVDNPEKSMLFLRPLLETKESIILYMPTAIVYSLIDFIEKKAILFNCN